MIAGGVPRTRGGPGESPQPSEGDPWAGEGVWTDGTPGARCQQARVVGPPLTGRRSTRFFS